MNCQIFETVVNDLASERMIDVWAEALVHSTDCEACALRLAHERWLSSGLRVLAAETKSVSASPQLEEQLRAAFRSQTSLLPQIQPPGRSRYWPMAAAAVVLIAMGIVGMKWGLEGPSQTAIEKNHNTEMTSPPKSIVVVDHPTSEPTTPKQTQAFYPPKRKQSRGLGKRAASGHETSIAQARAGRTIVPEVGNSGESEVTTQFLPLNYASAVNLQDGGQLVRVELPRSAMMRLGLPVNMERYGERVKADVLVSTDGLARAIRFVQ